MGRGGEPAYEHLVVGLASEPVIDTLDMHALVPVTKSDPALRIRLQAWTAEVLWN